ncbi:uncharacterized protein Z518_06431 [Rhinocladiella mackenziei CBS 650.93]|uniref:Peptidase family M20/M25/M40 protein n=1 Tax=Rhinocladiella mackenziei CBS 650.93 TaxID=1442369 RepID=A0A0D2IIJ9_9EURO|nr:uncharacterized protein Z518_06431 [Rhinocladiella mackenziei CBS 650.93]KIX05559.1 hypothetical protein Z518_06431 [Rhinocladiella mackenziei CBS 650.93]
MSTVPQPSPTVVEQSGWWPSERSAKSRFKAFFTRAKSEKTTRQVNTESRNQVLHLQLCTSSTNLAKRSRSHARSNRNLRMSQRNVRQNGPGDMTTWDHPPLIQAYTHTKLHDILDTPSTFTDALFRSSPLRRNSISSESPPRLSLDNSTFGEDGTLKHKRNWSGASTCSLSQKLFILTNSGHIFQYSADGLIDRLPEKILELGPESVAFASDAIPGKHWVLRIAHDGVSEQMAPQTPKSAWSKLAFRSPERKKLVNDLLLVFDDAMAFRTWLTAVRREIELLGGLEYRPDSGDPNDDEPQYRPRPPLKTQKSLPILPQSTFSPTKQSCEPHSPVLLPPMPQCTTSSRDISRSTTGSSIHTLNDLDRLREPSLSDDHSISTAHTSFTSSTHSVSHTVESLPTGADSYEVHLLQSTRSRVSTPTRDDIGELSMYTATPKKAPTRNPFPRRTTSLGNRSDIIGRGVCVHTPASKESDQSTSLERSEPNSRPISTIAPLPEPGHIRKTSARHRYELQCLNNPPQTPTSPRPSSIRSTSSLYNQDSPVEGTQRRRVSYSLFPKTPSSEQSPLSPREMPSPLATMPGPSLEGMCNISGTCHFPAEFINDDKASLARTRPSSKGSPPSSKRHGEVPSVDMAKSETGDKPQGSPAVAETHLQICCGGSPNVPRRKVSSKKSLSAIKTTTFESSVSTGSTSAVSVPKLGNPPRKNSHVKGQKSMPSLVHRPIPPSGPPPTGPLPALPIEAGLLLKNDLECQKNKLASLSSDPLPGAETQTKHVKAESTGPSFLSSNPVKSKTAKETSTNHARNPSSVSSVESVRHVTAWLESPRVAAFSAKCDTTPKLNIPGPHSPKFASGVETLLS